MSNLDFVFVPAALADINGLQTALDLKMNAADAYTKTAGDARYGLLAAGNIWTVPQTVSSSTNLDNFTLLNSGSPAFKFNTSSANAAARNWGFSTNNAAFGDFTIFQSSTLGGNPLTGNARLSISAAGAVGIRSSDITSSNGLNVPWISGDTLSTIVAGSISASNTQRAVWGLSGAGTALQGQSSTGIGVYGISSSGAGVRAESPSGSPLFALSSTTQTGVVLAALLLRHATNATPVAGFGTGISMEGSSTTTNRPLASINSFWADPTDATRKSRVTVNAYDTALREGFRVEASGSAPMIGFLGAAAVVRQTLPAAATDPASTMALVNSIRSALIAYGLAS